MRKEAGPGPDEVGSQEQAKAIRAVCVEVSGGLILGVYAPSDRGGLVHSGTRFYRGGPEASSEFSRRPLLGSSVNRG